jgi:hypothetical protein
MRRKGERAIEGEGTPIALLSASTKQGQASSASTQLALWHRDRVENGRSSHLKLTDYGSHHS